MLKLAVGCQERPKRPQETPRRPQERAKRGQERPKSGQEKPKSGQDGPKRAPRAAKRTPRAAKRAPRAAQTAPREPQERPREPTWANIGPTWANLGQLQRNLGPTQANKRSKTLSEITRQKVCRDHCRPIAQKPIGSVDGFGALAPNWIRPLSLSGSTEAVEAKRFEGLVVAAANNDETQRLPKVSSPKSPPAGSTLLPSAVFVSGDPWPKGRRN